MMTDSYSFFAEIDDPAKRKRALAEQAGKVIDEVIRTTGMPFEQLSAKLGYVKSAIREMNKLPQA